MVPKALLWLVVPAVGLLELGGHFYFSSRPPKPEDWLGVKGAVAALRTHDEVVVVAPEWAEPNARYAFGDALMPLADVARADDTAKARAIEVSIIGGSAPELAGWKLLREQRVGKFRLRVFANPAPAHVAYDFVDHLADATVADERSGRAVPCRWNPHARRDAGGLLGNPAFPAERFECPGAESHFVGVTVVEDEKWRGRRCIWAEPTSGAALSVRFDGVPVGKVVRGYATLPWWVEREERGAPVDMTILVGGREIGRYIHRDGDGWKPFEMPVGASAGTRTSVEFRIASRRAFDREFCFQADTR